MITSFSDFLVQLQRLIDQDENTPTDLPIKTLQQIVNMGERRIYREVRCRHNEKSFAVTDVVTGNLFPIPADFEAMSLIHFGNEGLLPTTEDVIRAYSTRGLTGPTKYFAQAGGSFTFSPAVTDATIVQGRYFYRLPDLTSATLPSNALMAAEPDLFPHGRPAA